MKQHHGICIPLWSIHTKNSCGIGEIYDLLPLIDWMKEVNLDTLQILPLNDSGLDSSPYSALSTCAINPIYLSLTHLPYLDKVPHLVELITPLKKLTATPYVNYPLVRTEKENWLHLYLEKVEHLFLNDPSYQEYLLANPWVTSYARFITLSKSNHYIHWQKWVEQREDPFKMEREKIIQFLLFEQLKKVKQHATSQGVSIMGDIPILVSSQSVDVWKNRQFFDLKNSVGVPPDVFSIEGQAWGFPFFNWDIDRKGAYDLWKQRLGYAENFYHLYRIDHIIGFFRLWKIPEGKLAKEGHYEPTTIEEATTRGHTILKEVINSSQMAPIGEDLGIILPPFKAIMNELKIPGIKVMRWERYWDSTKEFIPVEKYEFLNLICVSTHDTETLEQWWNGMPEESLLYCKLKGIPYRPIDKELRFLYLRDSHRANCKYHINLFHEYLALYPELVHDESYEERINIPSTQPEKNWRCRQLLPLEKITSHEGLKSSIADLIA